MTGEHAYIRNMFEDSHCSRPVVRPASHRNRPGSVVDTSLRTGSYYGWISTDNANCCVKAGQYDEASRKFCLTFPLKIKGHILEAGNEVKECCMEKGIFTVGELTKELQSEHTMTCLANIAGPVEKDAPNDDEE